MRLLVAGAMLLMCGACNSSPEVVASENLTLPEPSASDGGESKLYVTVQRV